MGISPAYDQSFDQTEYDFLQLVEVVDGLSYIHRLQVVHRGPKGVRPHLLRWSDVPMGSDVLFLKANIYIRNFRASIANFGVSTIARVDPFVEKRAIPAPRFISFALGGSLRWLNPQLLVPKISSLVPLALGGSLRWLFRNFSIHRNSMFRT